MGRGLPRPITPMRRLCDWLVSLSETRMQYVTARVTKGVMVKGGDYEPAMFRWDLLNWHLFGRRVLSIYLHQFLRSDDTEAMHDHPWWSFSLILRGSYVDLCKRPSGRMVRRVMRAGQWLLRPPRWAHRILLDDGAEPCWTLFVTGPTVREWGFHCPGGWVGYREFNRQHGCGLDVS